MGRKKTLSLPVNNYCSELKKARRIKFTNIIAVFLKGEFGSLPRFMSACEEAGILPSEYCNEVKLRLELPKKIRKSVDQLPSLGVSRSLCGTIRNAVQIVHPKSASHYDTIQRRIRTAVSLQICGFNKLHEVYILY